MIEKQFSVIFITLGNNCNFNCKYCLQDNGFTHMNKETERPQLSKKLFNFLDNYKYDHTKIMLWGGEPLLYFDSIKELVLRYGDKFDWGTITNGSLLTKEIVDFFEQHKISFTVSHDGEATEYTRGIDVLKNKKITDLLKNSKAFTGFSSVYSSVNNNYRRLFQHHAKLGFEKNNTGVDMIYNTGDTCSHLELANINEEKYKQTLTELFWGYEQVEFNNDSTYFKEWRIVKDMISALNLAIQRKSNSTYKYFHYSCSSCKTMLNINYAGDVFVCHNSTYKLGTVEDSYEEILKKLREYFKKWFTPKCKNCSAYDICQGACLLLTEKGQETFCNLRRIQIGMLCDWLITLKDKISKEEK